MPVVFQFCLTSPSDLGTILRDKYGMTDEMNAFLEVNQKKQPHLASFVSVEAQAHYFVNPDGSVGDLIRRAGPDFKLLAGDDDALKDGDSEDEDGEGKCDA